MERIECEHGHLKRQCETCDRDDEIADLRARIAALEADKARFLEILCEQERYAENVEEEEILYADWDHTYYKGVKWGAERILRRLRLKLDAAMKPSD